MVSSHKIEISALTSGQPAYPQRLAQLMTPPPQLYALGDADLNAKYIVAIVGTRSATTYARQVINNIVDGLHRRLPDGLLIVSGMALGCDIMAHRRAVDDGVPTVGVLAHGLDHIYPAVHRQFASKLVSEGRGMLLTQYPEGSRIHKNNFLSRNEIVAGMSDCVIVAESAADHGGALYTARWAKRAGRTVFAVPGRATDKYSGGCNMLIRTGAALLAETADDIVDAMGWEADQLRLFDDTPRPAPPQRPSLSPENKRITDYLTANPESSSDLISRALNIPLWELIGMLTELEMSGYVISRPGNRFMCVSR